jgi:hypothetical protein
MIKIAAKFSEDGKTYETSTTFKIVVAPSTKPTQMNQSPVFDSKIEKSFNIKIGDNWSYTIPTYSDPEGHKITLSVNLGSAGMFVTN